MKKWYFIFFILLLSLTACKDKAVKPQELQLSANGDFSNRINEPNVHIEMKVEESIYDVNTTQVRLFINNIGDSFLHTGTPYQIEMFKEDSWYKVPFKEGRGFTMVGIVLKPGRVYEATIGLEALDFNIIQGKYRVLKEFSADGKQITLSSEFHIK
jgi:hypothetical protein